MPWGMIGGSGGAAGGTLGAVGAAATEGPIGPPEPTSAQALWWANDLIGVGDGNPVGSWVDRIGGITVTASGSSRPTFDVDGIGGKPSVNFDGVNDRLTVAHEVTSGSSGVVVMVVRFDSLAQECDICSFARSNSDMWYARTNVWASKLNVSTGRGATPDAVKGGTSMSAGTDYAIEAGSAGSTFLLGVNNAAESLTVTSGTNNGAWLSAVTSRDLFTVGALGRNFFNNHLNGRLAFLGVYDQPLSSTDRDNLYGWINDTYGI